MYSHIKKRPQLFKRISWVTPETFGLLVTYVSSQTDDTWKKSQGKDTRGRNNSLCTEDQILLCLMYLRSYTTYLFLGSIFHVSEATAFRMSRKIETLLIRSGLFSLPKRTILQTELETIIVDATESSIERPKKKQKLHYSGKKKRHTTKTQIAQDKQGRILRTHFAQGRVHDKKLYDRSKLRINKKTKKRYDLWYKWVEHEEENVILPHKASKLHPLTKQQKQENRENARSRIPIEHSNRRIKVWRIFSSTYRNRRKRFWLRMNLVCGILNHEKWFKTPLAIQMTSAII